ncbi:alpha-glucan family phosphorylase [Paenibacillus radicis (ex Xue et al. 2023)]|uniref:Alpha-glucan family phosphorylase n=1 Tax=Paenibacillus radicis (ex Xue et al. 2023) TaxID=2972489 RepID=A0ABT1YKE4_9BACL|nr:alpha-glucan family phosphorylase [Paenibacillus radicis (ex Xue et al. 2023)]MCR8632864.1 alpha-glucan family phosphorylase [Paenibacillus radicis (ex Xue et al. 2023)]
MTTMFSYRNMKLPQTIERLPELAYNMWFSWNDDALELFGLINQELWDQFLHNPVRMLAETHPDVWEPLSKDSAFVKQYEKVIRQWDEYSSGTTWFQRTYPEFLHHQIAYFSAEFGFHESLPIYSGGLGVLAGDHCKSASDLGLPLIGIGLLYKKGYFNQKINKEGQQQAEAVSYDFSRLPILPALDDQGQELKVQIQLADRTVQLKIWQVLVGRVSLYLMDADLEENSQWDRDLTAQLYGGNQDIRIAQEILLGMGGVKTLRALGVTTAVYHINEGHAAFQAFERIKEQLDAGLPFHVAVEVIRASSVFTTHTPVPAGHDAFPIPMMEYYCSSLFAKWGEYKQGWTQLGLDASKQLFNMTHLALNTSALRNGVSKLHGQVSRDMFRSFHGNIDASEVPIAHITNGVHMNTWLAPELKKLYSRFLPGTWATNQTNEDIWKQLEIIPAESLWDAHIQLKEKLIRYVRSNLREHRRRNDMPADKVEEVRSYLSAKALTIGFARRFATYKRANLVFNDLERLDRLVNNDDRPVQFLFAGKAHPADIPGQQMIREIYRVSRMDRFRGKIILLENYDMNMARYLVQGVDVWLNNPRRPYEASGTSGQKAAMNGVINFSVLDGWWEEGYDGTNGWSIEGSNGADNEKLARENTESIYRLLEQEIVPLYYNQGKLPVQWVSRMKRSITTLAPVYNTDRMVMDYTNETYIPTLKRTMALVTDQYDLATKVADYKNFIKANWHFVKFLEINDGSGSRSVSSADAIPDISKSTKEVTSTIKFGPIWYKDTVVELLYYEEQPNHQWQQVIVTMNAVKELDNRVVQYSAVVPSHLRHGSHFSLRVRPVSPNFATAFELPLVTTL